MRLARYYRTARTVHIERLASFYPADLLYQSTMYDFDLSQLPDGATATQVTFFRVVCLVWRHEVDCLELAEPYAPSAIPQNMVLSLVRRISPHRQSQRVRFTAYAIENADLPRKYAAQLKLPVWVMRMIFRTAVGFIYRSFDRIAFGTSDARDNYMSLLRAGARATPPATTVIEGLPVRRPIVCDHPESPRLVFLGAFDGRKGVLKVIEAWKILTKKTPEARLVVMGKGPLAQIVESELSSMPSAELIVDPSRSKIWEVLDSSTALCLLSQPAPGWKEQIGLPIVEGLSSGLEIIATSETGVAQWLRNHSHRVVDPQIEPRDLAEAMSSALTTARSRENIMKDLPLIDGRLAADRWLHGEV